MRKLLCFLFAAIMFGNIFGATVSTSKASYVVGEAVVVNYTGSTAVKDWIGVYTPPTTPAGYSIKWVYCNSGNTTSGATVEVDGSVTFTTNLAVGTYDIYMCADDGSTVMAQTQFKVVPPAIASFSVSSNYVKVGESVIFTDQSTNNPTTWLWSFPGGSPSTSSEQNPIISYASEGKYDVSLTVTGPDGSLEISKTECITVVNSFTDTNLKVMQFNVWQEGTSVTNGMTYIRNIINSVDPDIVCFSEVRNYSGDWTAKIVKSLAAVGKTYYGAYVANTDVSLISKYPISSSACVFPLNNDRGSIASFVVNVNATPIVVCSAHLDYTYYATYLPRGYACGGSGKYAGWNALSPFAPEKNITAIATQNKASQRDEEIAAFIKYTKEETRPVLLLGDFNEPSCLDWTEKQANLYDHNGIVYEWNSTLSLKQAGFTDAYRQVYPDEVLNPGITWPSVASNGGKSTSWTPLSDERDRIDYIFFKGTGVSATAASLVGPQGCYAKNVVTIANNGSDIFEASEMPWPSDHKAVTASILIPAPVETSNISTRINSALEVRVFPNPTSDIINIISPENSHAEIEIVNVEGETVLKKNEKLIAGNSSLFDISKLSNGVYFLNITSNQKCQTIKLVKK